MSLRRGEVRGYDVDRMVVEFTMLNAERIVPCAISTAAMDQLDGRHNVRSDQRIDQFMALRDVIEARVSQKFLEELVASDRTVILRTNDFAR